MQKTGFFTKIIFSSISFQSQCMVINHAVCKIGLNSRQLCRTQRQAERRAAWPGTARNGMAASASPPRLFTSSLA
jgi:hypothetical protein